MPWSVRKDDRCPADKPWAVVKDADDELEGCHPTEDAAMKQQAALYASERSEEAIMVDEIPARDYVVRAQFDAPGTVTDEGDQHILRGFLGAFEEWARVDSHVEGQFMERILPGAFKRTIEHNRSRMRVIYDHGLDPRVGRAPLGPLTHLEESERGVDYEVPLLDTSYNRDLIPGLRAGMYGSSYRFRPVKMDPPVRPTKPTDYNPDMWEERSIRELEMVELGPTPFPVYQSTFAGLRSMTDEYRSRQLGINPEQLQSILHPAPSDGPEVAPSDPEARVAVPTRFRSREEYLEWLSRI